LNPAHSYSFRCEVMEKTLDFKVQVREKTGSKSAALVRSDARIPAIVYGHKEEPVAISLDSHDFTEAVHHGQRLLDVQIKSKKQKVIIKDLQYDHLGKEIIHADLMRVSATERVKVEVPIELKGMAKGTHEGGIVEEHLDHLEVECKVTEIPERIVIRVAELNIGDNIHARDVELPDGVKLVTDPDALVAACHVVAAAKTAEEAEEEIPAAPEVIGEEEKQQEEAEEESK
jgi:large subunit ribosomal protein L25